MDLSRVKTITIAHLDFMDLMAGRTGNAVAETDIPKMLRDAVRSGVEVVITDPLSKRSCRLSVDQDGHFSYAPIT